MGQLPRKYKTPYQFLMSAVRATGSPIANARPLLGMMDQLGMPLFGCLTPDGYKNTEEAWLSPDATTRRIGFAATDLARAGAGDLRRRRCARRTQNTASAARLDARRRRPEMRSPQSPRGCARR